MICLSWLRLVMGGINIFVVGNCFNVIWWVFFKELVLLICVNFCWYLLIVLMVEGKMLVFLMKVNWLFVLVINLVNLIVLVGFLVFWGMIRFIIVIFFLLVFFIIWGVVVEILVMLGVFFFKLVNSFGFVDKKAIVLDW